MRAKILEEPDLKTKTLMLRNQKAFSRELSVKLALFDAGMLSVLREQDIAEQFGVSLPQLQAFRKEHKLDINQCKDDIFATKKNILLHVSDRMRMTKAMENALFEGKEEEAKKIEMIIKKSEEVMPMSSLESFSKIIKDMDDDDQKKRVAASQVNIQVNNPAMNVAEEAMRKFKEENPVKVIDVEEQK